MIYTNQSAFDTVLAHLRQQKCKSMIGESCAYRGNDGLKCAIGVLIPEDKYMLNMDDAHEDSSSLKNVLSVAGLNHLDSKLCGAMQSAHDCNWEINENDWSKILESDFSKIAEEYSLTYTPPTQ